MPILGRPLGTEDSGDGDNVGAVLFALTVAAAAVAPVHASASPSLTLSVASTAKVKVQAVGAPLFTLTAGSSSELTVSGAATVPFTFTVASTAKAPVHASAAVVFTLNTSGSLAERGTPYATVVDGVVTAVTYGSTSIPASDDTTLYVPFGPGDDPEVGWYFSEVCGTFNPAPPVIPPGDIAPPYPPGSTPPDPGDPTYPPSALPPEDDPAPLAVTVPVLVPVHANNDAELTVTACPAALTEISTRLRTRFDFAPVCSVRAQTQVMTELAGASLIFQYSDDGGSTWAPLSFAGTGPTVSLAASGDAHGQFVNVADDALGDVIVSPFTQGGDDATDVVLGNTALLAYVKASEGLCLAIDEGGVATARFRLTVTATGEVSDSDGCADGGCAMDTATDGEDFSVTDTWDAFYAARGDQAGLFHYWNAGATETPGEAYFDDVDTFDCHPVVVGTYADGEQYASFVSQLDEVLGSNPTDLAVKIRLKVESGFDADESSDGFGFSLLLIDTPTVSGGYSLVYLVQRAGDIYLDIRSGGSWVASDVVASAAALADGTWKDLVFVIQRVNDTDETFTVYLNDACAAPTQVYQQTITGSTAAGRTLRTVDWLEYFSNDNGLPNKVVKWTQPALDTDPSVFGVTP